MPSATSQPTERSTSTSKSKRYRRLFLPLLCVLATETSLLHSWYLLNMNFSKALLKGLTSSRRS